MGNHSVASPNILDQVPVSVRTGAVGQRRAWADTKLSDAAAHSAVVAYSNCVLEIGPANDYMPTWGCMVENNALE